jgi:RNA recognition motif-containing protein
VAARPAATGRRSVIGTRVFVGNLSYDSNSSDVEQLLKQAGPIREVFLPTDRATGRPRGFAFVEFETPEAADEAIEKFDGYELDGRKLRVNPAEDRPPRRPPRSFDDEPPFPGDTGGGGGGRGGRPSRPKGSRRGLRGKKRSL